MMTDGRSMLCGLLCGAAVLVAGPTPGIALDYFVETTLDTNDGLCTPVGSPNPETCSLREAVIKANGIAGTDTIYLAPATYQLTIAGAGEDYAATGDLDIRDDVNIVGSGSNATRIIGFANEAVFEIAFSTTPPPHPLLQLYDLKLTNARWGVAAVRAGVYLWRVTIEGCDGAGISGNESTFLLTDSLIWRLNASWAAVLIADGNLFASRSTIADNAISVNQGAVLCQSSNVSLVNTTISGNHASGGQPVFAGFYGSLCNTSMDSCTIIDNAPHEIAVDPALPGTTTLRNNYVFGTCPSTVSGLITSQGGNVTSTSSAGLYCGISHSTDLVVPGDPLVMPMGFFGGFTPTRLPFGVDSNHPLVDNPNADAHCQFEDQRGILRPQDGGGAVVACDVGAVERKPGDYTHYWGDGFESGGTGNWSLTVP